jgi:hypothetical protein
MNTITITLEQLKELLATNQPATNPTPSATTARYVIVRGDRSGVFCGVYASEEGRTVELTECRHIWYWAGAANTAEMALTGVARPAECKFVAPAQYQIVLDAIEIIDCTPAAEVSLRSVSVWSKP